MKRADGKGRVAVREYLVFDRSVRDRFLNVPSLEWVNVVKQVFSDSCSDSSLIARTMTQSAERLVQDKVVRVADVSELMPSGIGFLGDTKL